MFIINFLMMFLNNVFDKIFLIIFMCNNISPNNSSYSVTVIVLRNGISDFVLSQHVRSSYNSAKVSVKKSFYGIFVRFNCF